MFDAHGGPARGVIRRLHKRRALCARRGPPAATPDWSGTPVRRHCQRADSRWNRTTFPRCGTSYAELTVPRRQTAANRKDVLFASHYNGRTLDPGADEVWDCLAATGDERLRLVQWNDPQDLQAKIVIELVSALKLAGPDDEVGFEVSLGGSRFKDLGRAFFSNRYGDNPGAASKVETWQMLSPVRGGLEGVDALNRAIQERFRRRWRQLANAEGWGRKVPKPLGSQSILYGDKVITSSTRRGAAYGPRSKAKRT